MLWIGNRRDRMVPPVDLVDLTAPKHLHRAGDAHSNAKVMAIKFMGRNVLTLQLSKACACMAAYSNPQLDNL